MLNTRCFMLYNFGTVQMRALGSQICMRKALLSSIAGISVILTAVKSFKNFQINQQGSCKISAFMSTFTRRNTLGLFMVDFDQTCNIRDTSELFYRASQEYRKASPKEKLILDEKWKQVTGKYLKEYREQISKSLSRFAEKKEVHYDEEGLHSFLKDIAKFNREATKDVDDSKLIAGVDSTGLRWAAQQVRLYPGCFDVLKSILPHVRIVSVNWSAEMIGYAFENMISDKNIFANHLLDNDGLSSGLIGKEMISSFDKKKVVQDIIAKERNQGVAIFVGDSITDLLSMLEADIGIIVGDSKTLLETAKKFGIITAPLANILQSKELNFTCDHMSTKQTILYCAKDWFQIQEVVQKLS